MDLHELSAGYALDALDPQERGRFEEHLAGCDACREELQGFWRTAGALAVASGGPAPPPALRGRILEAARAERQPARPQRTSWRERLFRPMPAFAAAAAALAVGLGFWSLSLSRTLDDTRAREAAERRAVAILSDPRSRSVPVSGADGRLVVSRTGTAALVLSGLDPAPAGKTYEIWVIEGGAPKPAGLFDGADTRTVLPLTRPVPEGAVVAVTLEPAGGVEEPTGSPLFSTGSV
jgi:anti-sigma-K factor RskA